MSLPASVVQVPVTCGYLYRDASGSYPEGGRVVFTCRTKTVVVDDETVTLPSKLVAILDATGEIPDTFKLLTAGDGVYYDVTEDFPGGRAKFTILVLTTDTSINLATAAPATVPAGPEAQEAQASATSASASAAAAVGSATDAAASAADAASSATNAAASATTASEQATAAGTSATAAASSATSASGSASTATTKAGEASTSAAAAASSATTASTKASEAATSATAASNSADAASTSASQAATSASAASDSATAAAASAATAAAAVNNTSVNAAIATDPAASREAMGAAAATDVIPSINAQTGTSYTAVLADRVVTMDNAAANTFTVPASATVAYAVGTPLELWQAGAGQTTIVADSGVTILYPSDKTLKLRAQHSGASLRKVDTDTWRLVGDLEDA